MTETGDKSVREFGELDKKKLLEYHVETAYSMDTSIHKSDLQQYDFFITTYSNDKNLNEHEREYLLKKIKSNFDKLNVQNRDKQSRKERQCENCKNFTRAFQYCEHCIRNYLQNNFRESTGNDIIDQAIQHSQKNVIGPDLVIEFIPFERLRNIEPRTEGFYADIFNAVWIDGPFDTWNEKEKELERIANYNVVLKKLKKLKNSDQPVIRWFNEIMSHFKYDIIASNIVRCYGLTKHSETGELILVLNFMDFDLCEYLENNNSAINWKDRYRIIYKISACLHSMHEKDLIHKDLHPGNVLLQGKHQIRISDLGFCESVNNHSEKNDNNPNMGEHSNKHWSATAQHLSSGPKHLLKDNLNHLSSGPMNWIKDEQKKFSSGPKNWLKDKQKTFSSGPKNWIKDEQKKFSSGSIHCYTNLSPENFTKDSKEGSDDLNSVNDYASVKKLFEEWNIDENQPVEQNQDSNTSYSEEFEKIDSIESLKTHDTDEFEKVNDISESFETSLLQTHIIDEFEKVDLIESVKPDSTDELEKVNSFESVKPDSTDEFEKMDSFESVKPDSTDEFEKVDSFESVKPDSTDDYVTIRKDLRKYEPKFDCKPRGKTIHCRGGSAPGLELEYAFKKITDDKKRDLSQHVAILKELEDSEYIVRFYGIAVSSNELDYYFVTEWMENGNLRDYYTNYKLDWNKRFEFAIDICRGIAFLNAIGTLHHDIRGSNILINGNHKAKIANFWLSRKFEDISRSNKVNLDNVRYMAPEMLEREDESRYNIKCEIYSLGVLLWEIAEKKIPYLKLGKNLRTIRNRIVKEKYREQFSSNVPQVWQGITYKALNHDPDFRPTIVNIFMALHDYQNKHFLFTL
ncbi:3232_t:CDS:10 [Gigaspora rosea]|nr:3232_t:CDS:10 [Gigaspora rosea]